MLISGLVNAQEWVKMGETSDGDKYYMQNRYSNILGSDNRKVWHKLYNEEFETLQGKKIKNGYALALTEYNCMESTTTLYEVIFYDSNNNIVERLKIESFDRQDEDVVPDTVGESMLQFACSL